MANDKLPPFQKFLASIFFVLFLASLVFIGYRIATKGEYTRREAEQCRILAISATESFAGYISASPDILNKLASGDVYLIIDHKLIPGNWNVGVLAKHGGNDISIEAAVKSGWNTRSPQEYTCHASLSSTGLAYAEAKDARTASAIRAITPAQRDKRLYFTYQDERLECPVKLEVSASKLRTQGHSKPFLILTATGVAD